MHKRSGWRLCRVALLQSEVLPTTELSVGCACAEFDGHALAALRLRCSLNQTIFHSRHQSSANSAGKCGMVERPFWRIRTTSPWHRLIFSWFP